MLGQWASRPLDSDVERPCSLYIHIPFCFHKCHYCDFYSLVDRQDRQAEFTDALTLELAALGRYADHAGLDSIFIGGGTPTLLRPGLWRRLLRTLDDHFNLHPIRAGDGEFTVECNPETATPELMAVLAAGGVNRLSVGAQSFDRLHLATLERWHDPRSVQRALALAAEAGIERRSVDLIFAIPGQSLNDWRRDLDAALSLDPGVEHLSCYALTYEPNTAMTRRLARGDFDPAPDDLETEMYLAAVDTLARAGFDRYEVSNFARRVPGAAPSETRSLHNLAYWRRRSWLAAGPSASAHLRMRDGAGRLTAAHQWKNVPRLTEWMTGVRDSGGFSPIVDHEPPDAARWLREFIMMGMRLDEGLPAQPLLAGAEALGATDRLHAAAAPHVEVGRLDLTPAAWRLTDAGFLHADGVAADLMDAI